MKTPAPPDTAPAPRDTAAEPSALAVEAWELVGELFWRHRPRMLAVWRELDLNPPQGMVMRLLDEPKTMSELAGQLACDNSNITGLVDRLEERNLVERRPAPGDRRVKLIVPTAEGGRVREEIERRLRTPPPEIRNLSEAEQRRLARLLQRALAAG
jgi:DNA-binding MarR family transcriptional regulator